MVEPERSMAEIVPKQDVLAVNVTQDSTLIATIEDLLDFTTAE
jgi:hypothetical protein